MVVPTRMLAANGCSVSETTGTLLTVTAAVPDTPAVVALIVAVPGVTPVTRPVADTVARLELLVLHVTGRVRISCWTSRTTAVSCWVVFWLIVLDDGDTVTLPTGTLATLTTPVPTTPV